MGRGSAADGSAKSVAGGSTVAERVAAAGCLAAGGAMGILRRCLNGIVCFRPPLLPHAYLERYNGSLRDRYHSRYICDWGHGCWSINGDGWSHDVGRDHVAL